MDNSGNAVQGLFRQFEPINSRIFFLVKPQMTFRIGLLFAVLVILAAGLWFIPRDGFMNLTGKTELDTSAATGPIEQQPRIYPARNTVPAGPASRPRTPAATAR